MSILIWDNTHSIIPTQPTPCCPSASPHQGQRLLTQAGWANKPSGKRKSALGERWMRTIRNSWTGRPSSCTQARVRVVAGLRDNPERPSLYTTQHECVFSGCWGKSVRLFLVSVKVFVCVCLYECLKKMISLVELWNKGERLATSVCFNKARMQRFGKCIHINMNVWVGGWRVSLWVCVCFSSCLHAALISPLQGRLSH